MPETSEFRIEFAFEVDDAPLEELWGEAATPDNGTGDAAPDGGLAASPPDPRMTEAIRRILSDAGLSSCQISVAIVDDAQIHELNRRYLDHDEPTDVISFPLAQSEGHLEGQLVVSLDTARAQAARLGWPVADELLLYVVHGTLHLAGFDDRTPDERQQMRQEERRVLGWFNRTPPVDEVADTGSVGAPAAGE
ncbi:MAG: rRNA maturation RNase YbeY [Planctomycetota bacterium]|nr:MAG: rRNA maturation RNase YbeY [Planctomycetota bacterium]REJ87108.1 MAG: rRNA maturation RNase YbeY [Planctomycetota bacterium]REK26974.1 MAG: rRNA maturation RNase YbeY [Planctomycetota bacterium]REK47299.1 MAG: rRNA maturation RNase YbeY [Planctomycetota bacterium]